MKISELPKEIRELALKRQKEAKRLRDENIDLFTAFVFDETPERSNFWLEIYNGNFSPYYEKYGKEEKEFPRRMLVWDDYEHLTEDRIVIGIANGKYQAVQRVDEENYKKGYSYFVYQWLNAKEIPTTKKVTFEVTEEQEEKIKKLLNKK